MTKRNGERYRNVPQGTAEWPVSRRTILKTGALASGSLVLGGASDPVAARRGGEGGFNARTPVIDAEEPDPDAAIVLATLAVPIRDWIVYGSETVADQNPAYDPDDRVVIVAYEDHLDSGWPDWRRAKPHSLFDGVVDRGIKFYAFPEERLDRPRSSGAAGFNPRMSVIDAEDPDPDIAIVLAEPAVPISDWIVYGSETVADQNPTYDPEDPVVIVAFEQLLDAGWPDWRRTRPATLFDGVVDRGIKFHAFPRGRLDRARSNGAKRK